MSEKKLLFIVGPTASGKSKLSNSIIEKFGGCIVNCDSLQVYEGLDIGTAKPSEAELNEVPNYLFSAVKKGDSFTAGMFRKEALKIIESTPHKLYVFVGGSGFYIQALVNGMFEETPIKSEIKQKVVKLKNDLGNEGLYKLLKEKDPKYASTIHQNDVYRVGRALELILSLNKTMGQIDLEFSEIKTAIPYKHKYVGTKVDREVLRKRVSIRLDEMLKQGFQQEVESLLAQGLKAWKPMQSVGYKEMLGLIDGQFTIDQFKEEVIKNTMRLAKRQMTWFKRNPEILWVDPIEAEYLDQTIAFCKDFLSIE